MNYYNYIETLASLHKLVHHTTHKKHYFRGELEEFYTDLRNKVNFPAIVAEGFELSFNDNYLIRETSFIVVVAYKEAKNWQNIYNAYDLCEQIGNEFIRKITADTEQGVICGNLDVINAVPLLDEQHLYAGLRYTINLSTPFNTTPNPDEWLL